MSILTQKTSGIYAIRNIVNGKIYIGSSINIHQRWIYHRFDLRHKRHVNRILQASWNKYGENKFEFYVIEYCDKSKLVEREQFYIDSLKPQYNIAPKAGAPNIPSVQNICKQCGKSYTSKNPVTGKFCSNACKSKWRRIQGLDNVTKPCVICGKEFVSNKYAKSRVCSTVCAGRLLWKNISKKSRKSHRNKVAKRAKMYYANGGKSPVSKPVEQFSIDGKFISCFESMAEASRKTGIDLSHIAHCTRGDCKTAGGFIWRRRGE